MLREKSSADIIRIIMISIILFKLFKLEFIESQALKFCRMLV